MTSIIIFLLVLSLLIAVHEAGHFVAAKACGIYVDRFSIGMPPRVFGVRIGETDYCLGALPIGGFVKMAGQEDAPLSEEEREQEYGHVPEDRWFNKKPVWQRMIVLAGGPFMNLVLALVLYGGLAAWGTNVPQSTLEARIGQVEENSPAASAPLYRIEGTDAPQQEPDREPDAVGWQTGDWILTMDGEPVENIRDLAIKAILGGPGTMHRAVLERPHPDGSPVRYATYLAPEVLDEESEHPRFGVAPYQGALVDEVIEDTPAAAAGLKPGDLIVRANGKLVDRPTFVELVENMPPGEDVTLTVQRNGERKFVKMTPETVGRIKDVAIGPAEDAAPTKPEKAAAVVLAVSPQAEDQTKLQPRDRIVAVNGEPVTFGELREIQQRKAGETIQLKIERPRILFGLIQESETFTVDMKVDNVRRVGVAMTTPMATYQTPPAQVVPEAFRRSYKAVALTLQTLWGLMTQSVSPKELGGPVMIFSVTTQAAEAGLGWLIRITAFISVNLAIFNLLPIPILDGGQMVVHGIEGIRRKPLSIKVQERYQQIGLLLIIALMLFVTWNDLGRLIGDMTP